MWWQVEQRRHRDCDRVDCNRQTTSSGPSRTPLHASKTSDLASVYSRPCDCVLSVCSCSHQATAHLRTLCQQALTLANVPPHQPNLSISPDHAENVAVKFCSQHDIGLPCAVVPVNLGQLSHWRAGPPDSRTTLSALLDTTLVTPSEDILRHRVRA